jgi:predicted PurR-regulated permease PerM
MLQLLISSVVVALGTLISAAVAAVSFWEQQRQLSWRVEQLTAEQSRRVEQLTAEQSRTREDMQLERKAMQLQMKELQLSVQQSLQQLSAEIRGLSRASAVSQE